MTAKTAIRGLGFHVPPKILTNADLEKMVDTTDEWITTRTGIKQRHVVEPGVPVSDLAAEAARKALASASMEAGELTHVLMATITPDTYCPSAACILAEKLGVRHAMAMDINAACSGFLYTLQTARGMIALDPSAKILIVGGEVLTSRTNWEDRATCVLFADGAGAAVVTAENAPQYKDVAPIAVVEEMRISSDGSLADLLTIRGGGSSRPYKLGEATQEDFYIQMAGREVYKHAVRNMEGISRELLDAAGLTTDDVDMFIPHQANLRIIEAVGKKLGFESERVFVNVHKYGNTSAACVPIALSEAWAEKTVKPGDTVLITTFGGGFTWGSAILKF